MRVDNEEMHYEIERLQKIIEDNLWSKSSHPSSSTSALRLMA
jgi:hypothetical protein